MSNESIKFNNEPCVAVLMCIKNGEIFLLQQLESILNQDYSKVHLHILVNNSVDSSIKVIEKFRIKNPFLKVFISQGSDKHFACSYIQLLQTISSAYNYEYYAFCDQDDIWEKNHLSRAIFWLKNFSKKPSLYCSRTELIGPMNEKIGFSPNFKRMPSFKNALVQSLAGANTMVFNKKSALLMSNVDSKKNIVSHDWLLYLIVTGSHGEVFYNTEASVLYRQHENNVIGSNKGLYNQFRRFLIMMQGGFDAYCNSNIRHLKECKHLSADNENTLNLFASCYATNKKLLRLFRLLQSGVYRQSYFGQIALYVNFIKKISEKFIK